MGSGKISRFDLLQMQRREEVFTFCKCHSGQASFLPFQVREPQYCTLYCQKCHSWLISFVPIPMRKKDSGTVITHNAGSSDSVCFETIQVLLHCFLIPLIQCWLQNYCLRKVVSNNSEQQLVCYIDNDHKCKFYPEYVNENQFSGFVKFTIQNFIM